jgi:hypothetical protein
MWSLILPKQVAGVNLGGHISQVGSHADARFAAKGVSARVAVKTLRRIRSS